MNIKKYNNILIILLTLLSITTLYSQNNVVLEGVVRDSTTHETLIGATVLVLGTNNGTVCDIKGKYRLSSIPQGKISIQARYMGYEPKTLELDINQGGKHIVNFNLKLVGIIGKDVVITAQAQGQIAAINKQLSSNTIENVISAKKIQEVPDANAAESLGRLPGVSVLRSGGEGNKVVIRGLAPKYNKVQVEGVKMAATGGDDRSSDMSMISPYMLEAIEVSKAAMADKEADVLGGSVNFVLREAPDTKKFDVLLQSGYSGLNGNFDNQKLVIGGSNRFFNKKLGIFAQIDLERRDRSSDELSVAYGTSGSGEIEDFEISTEKLYLKDIRRKIKRGGGTLVLDYKLNSGSIKLSNFVSVINKNEINRYEVYDNIMPFHTYGINQSENDIRVMTNALKINKAYGAFSMDFSASYSYSDNNLPKGINFTALETNAYTKTLGRQIPIDSVLIFAKNNTKHANVQKISKSTSFTKEGEFAGAINLQYIWNINKFLNLRIKSGVKYKKLNKSFDKDLSEIPVKDSGHGTPYRKKLLETFTRLSDTLGLNASKLPYYLFTDKNYSKKEFPDSRFYVQNAMDIDFLNELSDVAEDYYFTNYPASNKDDYSGFEEYKAAYLLTQFNIGKKITFIPGIRFENNHTEYTANRGDNTFSDSYTGYFFHDTTITRNNSFLLPMIHLKYKPTDWLGIRLAYTHTLARPSYNQIVPKWDISLSSIQWNNPYLVPSLSKNFDLQFTAYQNKLGLLSLGGFYKKIENLIFNAGRTIVKEEDIIKHSFPEEQLGTTISKTINNSNKGDLWGMEFEWQTRFWYLDNFLKGMILNLNYTYTFSDVEYERTVLEQKYNPATQKVETHEINSPYSERLLFQPKSIFNLTLGYDYKDFTSRLSFAYQNDIFSGPNFFRKLRGATDEYYRFDLSMKQKLPVKGFELLLNFSNITSAHDSNSLISTGYITRKQYYGYTIDLGLRYRL